MCTNILVTFLTWWRSYSLRHVLGKGLSSLTKKLIVLRKAMRESFFGVTLWKFRMCFMGKEQGFVQSGENVTGEEEKTKKTKNKEQCKGKSSMSYIWVSPTKATAAFCRALNHARSLWRGDSLAVVCCCCVNGVQNLSIPFACVTILLACALTRQTLQQATYRHKYMLYK